MAESASGSGSGSGGESVAEGLLSRLDAKLDELERTSRLSVPQLQEQMVGGGFDDGQAAPMPAPGCGLRQPLRDAVLQLNTQWSEGFLAMAREGDPASQCIVAQMSLQPRGYGCIPFNKAAGLMWLFTAVDKGDLEARAYARRIAHKQLIEHLARKELADEDASQPDKLAAAMERWTIKDKEMEVEERRIAAAQEAESDR